MMIYTNSNTSNLIDYQNSALEWRDQVFADETARWQIFAETLDHRPGLDEWLEAWRQYRLNLSDILNFKDANPDWPQITQKIERERLALREAWRQWQNAADDSGDNGDN